MLHVHSRRTRRPLFNPSVAESVTPLADSTDSAFAQEVLLRLVRHLGTQTRVNSLDHPSLENSLALWVRRTWRDAAQRVRAQQVVDRVIASWRHEGALGRAA